jgi:hypothetical protein
MRQQRIGVTVNLHIAKYHALVHQRYEDPGVLLMRKVNVMVRHSCRCRCDGANRQCQKSERAKHISLSLPLRQKQIVLSAHFEPFRVGATDAEATLQLSSK